jgi:hypothetical protein
MSETDRLEARRLAGDNVLICPVCDRRFVPAPGTRQVFCSKSCYLQDNRKRARLRSRALRSSRLRRIRYASSSSRFRPSLSIQSYTVLRTTL